MLSQLPDLVPADDVSVHDVFLRLGQFGLEGVDLLFYYFGFRLQFL